MSWRDRLRCERPEPSDRSDTTPTSVTSVSTSTDSQQASLVLDQPPLDVLISSKAPQCREPDQPNADDSIKAMREIACLLAIAYRRYAAMQRVATERPTNPVND